MGRTATVASNDSDSRAPCGSGDPLAWHSTFHVRRIPERFANTKERALLNRGIPHCISLSKQSSQKVERMQSKRHVLFAWVALRDKNFAIRTPANPVRVRHKALW